jgi:hypothetical protein
MLLLGDAAAMLVLVMLLLGDAAAMLCDAAATCDACESMVARTLRAAI